jgi:hypothetical protein
MENQGYGGQGEYTTSAPPGVQSTNPNVASAAPEKRGIADKVKGMLGGHGHKTDAAHHDQQPVYGDATPASGTADSTRVGCLEKLKAKAGVGHGLAPEQTKAQGGGLTGHHAGGAYTDPSASPDFNGGTNVNSSAAVHGGWPQPSNPNQTVVGEPHPHRETHNHPTGLPNPNATAGGYGATNPNPTVVGEPHPHRQTHNHPTGLPNPFSQANPNATAGGYGGTNPTGVTNAQGGAVLGDNQGNVHEGPRDDIEKKEGFVSKIMDKLHSPKGKPAHNTTPNPY